MKKTLSLFFMVILMAGLSFGQFINEYGQDCVLIVKKIDTYADGSHRTKYYVMDPETGMPMPLESNNYSIAGVNAVTLQQLVLTYSLHWDWPTKINFVNTKDAKVHKKKNKKIINNYWNKRRGTNNVPKGKVTSKTIAVKPMSSFTNPNDYYIQFWWDKRNAIIMTSDDQFFRQLFGGPFFDPEIVTSTIIFASATLTRRGNRWVGVYFIVEADVYLRSDFFQREKLMYERLGTAAFRMTLGFLGTTWSHDFLSNKGHHVNNSSFASKTSLIWTITSFNRDAFYYTDKMGLNFSPVYHSTPMLMPHQHEVIDIGEYELPKVFEDGRVDLGKTPILFLTNLKGYDGKKKMIVIISRRTTDNPPKNVKIVKLKGNTMRYPQAVGGSQLMFYPTLYLNNVRLGRAKDLNKLKAAVNEHGTDMWIDGVKFDKVIQITVKITGYLEEDGKKKSIVRVFYLANTVDQN